MLSLELILHSLQHSGPAFRSGEKFVQVMRQQLCVSLLRNCTSQISQVTGVSLQIFVCLMDGFKDHLKSELEVFVAKIFIRILESENASFEHKMSVLEVFHIICTEPSAMVEIFINYDCDMEAIDLFRRIVDGFSKITKVRLILPQLFGISYNLLKWLACLLVCRIQVCPKICSPTFWPRASSASPTRTISEYAAYKGWSLFCARCSAQRTCGRERVRPALRSRTLRTPPAETLCRTPTPSSPRCRLSRRPRVQARPISRPSAIK